MEPRLQLSKVRKSYGTFAAVRDIDLSVRKGEFLTLLGPSGCGKTTTLRLIGGMERLTAGTIEINGGRVDRLPSYKRDTATVFQSGALFPHMTVAENMAYGLRMRGVAKADIPPRVRRMLDVVRMGSFAERYPAELSGGQRQRVALARAMVIEPSILLFDEPMSALDLKLKLELRSEIRRLHEEIGFTAVFVTHDQGEAMTLSDRVAIMNTGRIEQIAPPVEIYEKPASEFVYTFVGESCCLTVEAGRDHGDDLRTGQPPGPGRYRLYLRPSHLKLDDAATCDCRARARVLSVEYLGGFHRIHGETPAGNLFVDVAQAPSVRPGGAVTIGWSNADATWFGVP
jgi:ABC-type Fe3+/spermidine/putrescine transport system ATPase subunit